MLRKLNFAPAGIQNGVHRLLTGIKSYIIPKLDFFWPYKAQSEPKCPKVNIMSSGEQVYD